MDTVNAIMFPSLLWLLGNPGQWYRPHLATALDLLTNILYPNFISPFILFSYHFPTDFCPSPLYCFTSFFFNPTFPSSSSLFCFQLTFIWHLLYAWTDSRCHPKISMSLTVALVRALMVTKEKSSV